MAAVLNNSPRSTATSGRSRAHLRLVAPLPQPARSEAPRGAIVIGCLVLFLVLGAFTLVNGRGGMADAVAPSQYRPADPSAATVVVEKGDTLWSIARSVQPSGDVRPLVDELISLNGTMLKPGQVVVLPA